jgi:predicted tellurium resistance membrane protein TerC
VPAVFGVTTDPFLAFTSNGFAILGLRSLYTLVASAVAEFEYLRPAIAAVLAFIGFKLIGGYLGFEVSTAVSLAVVAGAIGAGVTASVCLKNETD